MVFITFTLILRLLLILSKEVESSSLEKEAPYMMFYQMDNLNAIDYMPNIKEKDPINFQQEEDEFEKEVKKYCSIM